MLILKALKQGRSQEFVFFIIRGANHANLYKNLIKIQIFNVNLGVIGGPGPCPPPVYAPDEGGSGRRRQERNRRQELERGQVGSVFKAHVHLAYVDVSRAKTRLVWVEGAFVSGFGSWGC